MQRAFKAGRKYKALKPSHPSYLVSVSALLWASPTACGGRGSLPTQASVGGLWLMKPTWGMSLRHTCTMMAYLQDILLIPWAWRKHKSNSVIYAVGNLNGMPAPYVEFSAHTQWTVDYFYILGKLFFQECGSTVKSEA